MARHIKYHGRQKVTLTFNENGYGEVTFKKGQELEVMDITEKGYVFGRIGHNEIEVHVSQTNFASWFEKKHGDAYTIITPEKESIVRVDGFEDTLITQMRRWCLKNYNTPLIEIQKNTLVMQWKPFDGEISQANYDLIAMNVARAYLRIQAKLGGKDNYASCEIRDPDTGELMGSKGTIIPRL